MVASDIFTRDYRGYGAIPVREIFPLQGAIRTDAGKGMGGI